MTAVVIDTVNSEDDDDDESNLLPRGRVITQQSGSLPVYTKVTWEVLQSDMYISGGEYRVV